MARIHAVINRSQGAAAPKRDVYEFEGLKIDMVGRNVYVDGERAELTPKEYELLFYFVENRGVALTRERLLNQVWGTIFTATTARSTPTSRCCAATSKNTANSSSPCGDWDINSRRNHARFFGAKNAKAA